MFYNTVFESYAEERNALNFQSFVNKLKVVQGKKKSKRIYIVSCFYSIDAIRKLFDELPGREVHLVVSAIGSSIEKLNKMRDDLSEITRKGKKYIYICDQFLLLHSKIYYAECSQKRSSVSSANCLVGSSNLSFNGFENNEEILVDVDNAETKRRIRAYIISLLKISKSIDKKRAFASNEKKGESFISFISSGYMVFKPSNQIKLTYSEEPLRKAIESLKATKITNANINMELSINLEDYITKKEYLNLKMDTNFSTGARIKDHCIETCFGYWCPPNRHYYELMDKRNQDDDKEEKVDKIIECLNQIDVKSYEFDMFFNDFLSSLKENLGSEISGPQKREIKVDIEKFITRQKKYLKKRKESIANAFFVSPMPYIWDDYEASKEFYETFWENIDLRNRGLAREIKKVFENYEEKDFMSLKMKENAKWE